VLQQLSRFYFLAPPLSTGLSDTYEYITGHAGKTQHGSIYMAHNGTLGAITQPL
jgi:hypothetical protein